MEILKLTDPEYFALNRYSNSDLSALEREILGKPYAPPTHAFRFGTAFHAYVLESREPPDADPAEREENQIIKGMTQKITANTSFVQRQKFGLKEITVLWDSHGLKLKSKLDIAMSNQHGIYTVCDLKSTAARTTEQFEETITEYHYDRQAAFYMDSIGAKRYEIWAVSKAKPHHVFYKSYAHNHPVIELGRKKYRRLLRAAVEQNWRPSQWIPPKPVMGCPFDEWLPPLTHDKRAGYTPGPKMSELRWQERYKDHIPGPKMAELLNRERINPEQ